MYCMCSVALCKIWALEDYKDKYFNSKNINMNVNMQNNYSSIKKKQGTKNIKKFEMIPVKICLEKLIIIILIVYNQ